MGKRCEWASRYPKEQQLYEKVISFLETRKQNKTHPPEWQAS